MKRSGDFEDSQNLLSTYGALFFGVPGQGMSTTAIANMIGDLPARFTLSLLDKGIGHRFRDEQHENFCEAFHFQDSKIIQFFELRSSPTVRKVAFPAF